MEPEALTLRHFLVHTVAHELLDVDAALWRTLRLLFGRPGQLSLEYAAGRRRPYVNPFRLLLIAVVAYALMTSSGRCTTGNFGPVTVSAAPAVLVMALIALWQIAYLAIAIRRFYLQTGRWGGRILAVAAAMLTDDRR